MVMGGDSCSKGREFESRHRILDGHFTFICCKSCNVSLNGRKLMKKRPGLAHLLSYNNLTSKFLTKS